ncbi:MAG TPA: peptide ABC transporter substrate-binding protein [Pyrinomonadaceae bacterium]|nr:peptide ABC transporter substrate-binding protein [Pyrinomonadaceae bacterium]
MTNRESNSLSVARETGRPLSYLTSRTETVVCTSYPRAAFRLERIRRSVRFRLITSLLLSLLLLGGGCFEGERGEQFYGKVTIPRAQEFRWSDGGLPKIFDPALAATPPDTDAVRAMFEGLTDYDPRQLKPVSAIATHWESSHDKRQWTFYLRKNARWSNGDAVTAHDFVHSWRRTLRIGERAPHAGLMENIEGARALLSGAGNTAPPHKATPVEERAARVNEEAHVLKTGNASFGAAAIEDYILHVQLLRPDENFPELLAHPVFRPVHRLTEQSDDAVREDTSKNSTETKPSHFVSNGAFRLSAAAPDGVVLERDVNYWDAGAVALERVRFVAAQDAEQALAAYRAGEVDAVTNTSLEPLALKLLTPYKDFHRTTYGALTYYTFNTARAPFDDLRVRRALSLAVDRARISGDTMGGTTKPATTFLPVVAGDSKTGGDESARVPVAKTTTTKAKSTDDADQARRLMAEAGYSGGANFPTIRLLVNRNDQHRQVAQAVAGMWQTELGVQTEIVIKDWEEYKTALSAGEYDIARRSMVMQTLGEEANMREMFVADGQVEEDNQLGEIAAEPSPLVASSEASGSEATGGDKTRSALPIITTEAQALRELPGMPIYFASSNALVKPYVTGFEPNLLDAYSLKNVRIDTTWKAAPPAQIIRIARNE